MKCESQSPQIGSMFPTYLKEKKEKEKLLAGRNPLKSGQCFLLVASEEQLEELKVVRSQSPQIGSMFPTVMWILLELEFVWRLMSQSPQIGSMFPTGERLNLAFLLYSLPCVAIPSNRVNVSYIVSEFLKFKKTESISRNPLKSGQCFLPKNK